MFLSSNFTYVNLKGEYFIGEQPSTDKYGRPIESGQLERYIITLCEKDTVIVETNVDPNGESVALKFASIDIYNDESILKFCREYGSLFPNEYDEDEIDNNDYLFEHQHKNFYQKNQLLSERVHVYDQEAFYSIPLIVFQTAVISVRKLLELSAAISNQDYITIIKGLIWFCFGNYDSFDDEELVPATEFERINYYYREAIDRYINDDGLIISNLDYYSDAIILFLDELARNLENIEKRRFDSEHPYNYSVDYYDLYNKTWTNFYHLIKSIIERYKIIRIDLLGDVVFEKELSNDDISHICPDKEMVVNLGKAFLSNHFNDQLFRIRPELIIEDGRMVQELRIPSLMEAIYIDLYFRYTPYTSFRKCSNPTCSAVFQVSNSNSKKMYCSNRCSLLMAKRKQRERDRKRNSLE